MTLGRGSGCGALMLVCLCVGVSCSPLSHSDGCLNVCGCLCVFAALPRQCYPPLPQWAAGDGEPLSHIDQFMTSHDANIFGVKVAVTVFCADMK